MNKNRQTIINDYIRRGRQHIKYIEDNQLVIFDMKNIS